MANLFAKIAKLNDDKAAANARAQAEKLASDKADLLRRESEGVSVVDDAKAKIGASVSIFDRVGQAVKTVDYGDGNSDTNKAGTLASEKVKAAVAYRDKGFDPDLNAEQDAPKANISVNPEQRDDPSYANDSRFDDYEFPPREGEVVVETATSPLHKVQDAPDVSAVVSDVPSSFVVTHGGDNAKQVNPSVEEVTTREAIKLNSKQLLAVTTAIENPYSNIIGYAGSGKTTAVLELVRQLIASGKIRRIGEVQDVVNMSEAIGHLNLNANSHNFAMVAFTGLAVKALRKAVPNEFKENCYTIHKLIDFGPVEVEVLPNDEEVKMRGLDPNIPITKRMFEPRKHGGKCERYCDKARRYVKCGKHEASANPTETPNLLALDYVLIDEFSMLGMNLWGMLMEALPPHCRIVTIGDIAQLPPVMDNPVQPLALAQWPTTELTEIYRQKDGDMISNANAIRQCQQPVTGENFRILQIDTEESIAQQQALMFIEKEYKEGRYDPELDVLITPLNVGLTGQEMLNVLTRQFVNPNHDTVEIKTMRGNKRLAVGDRVLCKKNDNEIGLYNGMLGWVSEISLNAGMGIHADNGGASDDDVFDVGAAMERMQQEQAAKKERDKVNAMFGGSLVDDASSEDGGDDNDEGTGKRKSSHAVHVQFDYEVEDDPTGTQHFHTLGSSSQLENLIPAWWITIHKSQGSGFRNVYILLHNKASIMLSNELLYTAVTRCVEKVTVMTTKYAWAKCLKQQKIKGATLQDKIQSSIDNYLSKVSADELNEVYIPSGSKFKGWEV